MVDYLGLYSSCELTTDSAKLKQLDYVCRVALTNESIYQLVSHAVNIPWPLIAAIHFRESDQSFKCHLHNGDPLTSRTSHVPAGRPVAGNPPFTWVESATDALKGVWRPLTWDLATGLEFLEKYNGTGYQKHGVNTPYLWDFTDHYESGLYQADGTFSPTAQECRPGAVAILKTLEEKGVSLDFPAPTLLH